MVLAACADSGPVGSEDPEKLRIRLKQGIAGVRLEMTREQVSATLGRPDGVRRSELHGGWTTWVYRRPRTRVTFDAGDLVWDVRTYSRDPRAPGGVGVGSSEREVRRALPSVRCRPYGGPARYREWRVCSDTRVYSGPFTTFTLVRGRVAHVTVARGLAL
jgi:hypothetical protein